MHFLTSVPIHRKSSIYTELDMNVHSMKISRKKENGIIHIIIEGRLDADSAPKAEKFIKKILKKNKNQLLFDLCALDYMSSAGLRIILMAAKEIYLRDGKIVFCCLNEPVKDILECSPFPIADSVEDGIKQFFLQ